MTSIVISALNTRHTHSALGLAYIKSFWEKFPGRQPLHLAEFDLNQTNDSIIAELVALSPCILAFSVYIWSLPRTLAIAGALKAAFPEITIILGGPEVSFNSEEVLNRYVAVDLIVRGEGEVTFQELLTALLSGRSIREIAGVTFREAGQIIKNPDRGFISNLDDIPSPFRSGSYKTVHSFTYYEASRGCPSKCSYCLSSVLGPVRNHSIERVKADLDWFFASDYRQIRFTDRTFNFDLARARQIISYIKQNNHSNINFHFEIQADFLSEEIIDLLADAPDGMFHLEIGVQSTNPEALRLVNRRFNLTILRERITALKKRTRCYLHVDLLGALPGDTLHDFYRSLDDVWALEPHGIQISLVKVLRGTPLQQLVNGVIAAMPDPPYTVLRTSWLAPEEAMLIQDIGKLVEGTHNGGRFPATLKLIVCNCFAGSASRMYDAMANYWRVNHLQFYNFSPENLAHNLLEFLMANCQRPGLRAACRSLIEHELRLALKYPAGETVKGPDFAEKQKKQPWRVTQGIRVFWYEQDPLKLQTCPDKIEETVLHGVIPVAYRFDRDFSAVPSVEILQLEIEEAFMLGAIQQRSESSAIETAWAKNFPEKPLPDFATTLEKLQGAGLLYKV
ncbi:MAG TPA: DUF4080 domain-containing protein [Candidatus Rifleibacterium sp.]|nr:DUF4080 domain-containing protein [Candidatus Rifleibacterium sp.]